MTPTLTASVVLITLALVFYSIGVWSERLIVNFHKFSILVWLIWLIPYFNGFFVSMRR